MKGILRTPWAVLTSRATVPVVMGVFLAVYIVLAFFTDETLVALIALTGHNPFLIALFAVIPASAGARLAADLLAHLARRRALKHADPAGAAHDETVRVASSADPSALLKGRLEEAGYRTLSRDGGLAAWRGASLFPARMLYRAAMLLLFAGILISLSSRSSLRSTVIEGEPITEPGSGRVERIALEEGTGAILAKRLDIVVAGENGARETFGLYPPSRYRGAFVYPRYLGLGLLLRFEAPDLNPSFEEFCPLNISRPGKEASQPIPGSPYRILFTLASPGDDSDPYVTGKLQFLFKLVKDKEVVLTGSLPAGGEFARDGYRLQIPDARRVVITDFIRDYGVTLIWTASLLFSGALLIWLPIRLAWPRREMIFRREGAEVVGASLAEGGGRRHAEVFQEALDLLENGHLQGKLPKEG